MNRFASRKIIFNALLFIGSLVFVIIILEICLRVYLRDDYSVPSHSGLLFRESWESKFGNLNTLGHRDHKFAVVKPHDTFRILAIGDSFTYGEGIKQINDIYTEILESKLNDNNGTIQYEVLNVAQRGWNVKEYLSVLKDKGLSYQPDLVMIGFFMNDIEKDKSKRPKLCIIIPEFLHRKLSKYSYLYWHAFCRYKDLKDTGKWVEYLHAYASPESNDWKRFVSYWLDILSLCKINEIKTLVLILPHNSNLDDSHPFLYVYRNVEDLSKDNGADVLNLFPALKGHNPSDLHIGITDSHPNANAHQIYANEIYNFIKEQKLVPLFK